MSSHGDGIFKLILMKGAIENTGLTEGTLLA